MKKIVRMILSILLTLSMLTGVIAFDVLAQEQQTVKYHYFGLAEDFLPAGYRTEIVDGILYAYIVENGEATILNTQIQRSSSEKSPMVFPVTLGGYPVTTIGGDRNEIFLYLSYTGGLYPEGYDEETGYGYAEYDPNLWVSEFVIPEGYKYISSCTFYGSEAKIVFPKSLRKISGTPFEILYTHVDENGEKHTVLPECQYDTDWNSVAHLYYGDVYFPSRLGSEYLLDNLQFYPGTVYIPSNYSYYEIYRRLMGIDYDEELNESIITGDPDKAYGRGTTIHCAPDSDFLRIFEEAEGYHYYTIITDVVPAEYIEFPKDTVNVHVGDVVDLEAKTYPTEAIWTACDYTVSDPSIVKIDEYSGRITALKEGTVTVTATHCERGYVDTCTVNVTTKPAPGVNGIEPATDTPYVAYGNRDYKINVTGSPSKIQVVRDNGGTTTIDRRRATVTSNGDTETWIVNMRVEAGTHNIRAKYGKVWEERLTRFTVEYDLPTAYSFDLTYENGMGTFEVVTDPEVIKVQLALDNGCTLTYSQVYSHIGEDGLRHWTMTRKLPADTKYTLKTKYGYTWTTTEFTVST